MGLLILLIVASLILGAAAFIMSPKNKGYAALLLLIPVIWLSASVSIVSAGNQKVQSSFGKVTGVNGAGWNWVAPWSEGTSFSTRNQWVEFKEDPGHAEGPDEPRIPVRLAGQATADVYGIVSYTQPPEYIDDLYLTWKSEERIRSVYVYNRAKEALNQAFGEYDPLSTAKLQENVFGVYGAKATDILRKMVTDLPDIKVSITNLDLDDKTEEQLRSIQAAVAQTRAAEQAKLTADALAAANRTISASLSGDPVVAFYQCSAMWSAVLKEIKPQTVNISAICAAAVPTGTR